MELKPGDVVILKSGGHPLTVAEVNDDTVECLWMGGEGDLFRETLPKAVLEPAEIDDSEDEQDHDEDESGDEDESEDDQENEDDDDHKKGKHKKSKAA
jgi:uncharacterized protein YodC (DUF2158 family)